MPRYRVTDPTTGRKLVLTGDSPPTEQELEMVFRNHNAQQDAIARGETIQAEPDDVNSFSSRATEGMTGMGRQMMKTALIPADFVAGAVKGVGQTAGGALQLLNKFTHDPDEKAKLAQQFADATPESSGNVEKAGSMAEHAAEFAIPGAMGLKAPAAASMAGRMAVGAGEMAGVRAVQRGDTEHLAGDAAMGAAFPLVGPAWRAAKLAASKAGPIIERGAELAGRASEYIPGSNIVLTPTMRKAIARGTELLAKRRGDRALAAGDAVAGESVAPAALEPELEQDFPLPGRRPKPAPADPQVSVLEEDFPTPTTPRPKPVPQQPRVSVDEAGPSGTSGPAYPQGRPRTGPAKLQPPNQPRAQASVQQAQESTSKPSSPKTPKGVDDAQSTPQGRAGEAETPAEDAQASPEEDTELAQLLRASIDAGKKGQKATPAARPDLGASSKLAKLQAMLATSKTDNVGGYAGQEYRAEIRKAIDAVRAGDTSLANLILSRSR